MFVRSFRSVAVRQLSRGQLRRGVMMIPMVWRTLPMIQVRGIQFGAMQPDPNGDALVPSKHATMQQPNSVASFEEALQSLKVGFSIGSSSSGIPRTLPRCQFESASRLRAVFSRSCAYSIEPIVQCPQRLH